MAAFMRTEAGDFDVITQQIRRMRNDVFATGEKLLLIIEARPPGEVRTDLQVFALAVPGHVGRMNAFSGRGVMRAARRVNMMIATPPAQAGGIDPAPHLKAQFLDASLDIHSTLFRKRLGA